MKKVIITFFIIFSFSRIIGQIDCPAGYVPRNVKCNGLISIKCIPANFSCKQCWTIEWPNLVGEYIGEERKNTGKGLGTGGASFYSTYERCVEESERVKRVSYYKDLMDVNNYKIYVDGIIANFCNSSIETNQTLKNDLLRKIKPFIIRFKDEIANYRRYLNGQQYKPGATFKEYETQIKQAEENISNLENMLNVNNDDNLKQIENAFNELQIESQNLKRAYINYKSQFDDKKQIELQNKSQEIIDEQINVLNRKIQLQSNIGKGIVDGLGSFFNMKRFNEARQEIIKDNSKRTKHFEELKKQIQTEEGDLIDCKSCFGQGYTNCGNCGSSGKNTCSVCSGLPNERCYKCGGSGKYQFGTLSLLCTVCSGKGIKNCTYCGNSGQIICSVCNGLGRVQCAHCFGTGQKFKKNYSRKYQVEDNTTVNLYKPSEGILNNENSSKILVHDTKVFNNLRLNKSTGLPVTGIIYEMYNNSQFKFEYSFKDGKADGVQKEWHENGQLAKENNYKDGKLEGWQRQYSTTGQLLEEVNLVGGNGVLKEKYNDGKIKIQANFKDGLFHGIYKFFDLYGNLSIEHNFNNGLPDGPQRLYSYNGRLFQEYNFKFGKHDGLQREWDLSNGRIIKEYSYKSGKLDGFQREWDTYGKTKSIKYYKDSLFVPSFKTNETKINNSNIMIVKSTNEPVKGIIYEFFKNGKIKCELSYIDGKKEGVSKHWYKNGVMSRQELYMAGKLISEKCWDEDEKNILCVPISDDFFLQRIVDGIKIKK